MNSRLKWINQKMLITFCIALVFTLGRCRADQNFLTKTVHVGEDVTLTCSRQGSKMDAGTLFWVRLHAGNLPEVLGATYTFDSANFNKTPRITAKQEPGTFVLHITKTELSDTAFYYCEKHVELRTTFLNITFLRVKGPEPDITTIIQVPPSDPVRPGDSVTLQCSVLSDSEKKTCPGDHSVYWFRAGADESHPSFIYAHGNRGDQCEKSPEAQSTQKCVYNFSKTVTSSDAGTHYCAVAMCGKILFGNGMKLDTEDSELNMWDLQKANTLLFVLSATLALSLIGVAFLIYIIKKKTCDCCKAADAATVSGYQQSQQREEDSLTYSAATFTKRKAGKAEKRNVKTAEGETVYTGVRAFVID